MISFKSPRRVLVVSPHPDDETLGAGGTIARMGRNGFEIFILTVSGHLPPLYERNVYETTIDEAIEAYKTLGVSGHSFLEIPATMVGAEPTHILNGKIAACVKNFEPEIVLCPFPDRHIDHRIIFESTQVATRPVLHGRKIRLVAAYETLSETHWNAPYVEPNFTPNFTIDINESLDLKIDALRCYKSQVSELDGPRSIRAARALAEFRGSQSGFEFGEAFYILRCVA